MRLAVITIAFAMVATGIARAQVDPLPYVSIQASNIQYGEMLKSNLKGSYGSAARSSPRVAAARPTYAGLGNARYFSRPASSGGSSISFAYDSTPALRQAAADGYVERASASNAEAGRTIAREIARNDFSRIYAGIIAPFGFRSNDTADAIASYTLLGWLIATGSPDPTPGSARAVRNQVAQGLAGDPRFRDPRTRAELAEEMKLLFVTLHAGWQSARREGNLRTYSDGVAAMFKRFSGNDLRAMRLTSEGFARG